MNYQEYKTQFYAKRQSGFSSQPMSQTEFDKMMKINEFSDTHRELRVRPKKDSRPITPTMEVHK